MTRLVDLFVLLSLLELCVVSRRLWPLRRPLAVGVAIALSLISGGIMGQRLSLATTVFAVISLYRVVSLLRVVKARSQEQRLRSTVRWTTCWLFAAQVAILTLLAISDNNRPSPDAWWLALALVQLLAALGLFVSTQRQLRKLLPPNVSQHFSDAQLPSLSVCIPARNETTELEECLRSLVASEYPKLEILVLDDCSQGRHTSDIIRSFAHDGVRFIEGTPPADAWLAKNWAYEQLYEASNASYLVFCGVDVRFEPAALRAMVTTLLAKQKRMLSVLPQNELPKRGLQRASLLLQPVRYAWELCLPRRLFNRPPVLSSCWLAERTLIDRNGSFAAVRNSILPEVYFARKATLRDGYSFVQSSGQLAVTSRKSLADQWETAIRTRYPQVRRRPELVLFVSLIELSLLAAPVVLLIIGVAQDLALQALVAFLAVALNAITYAEVVTATYQRFLVRSLLLAPFAVLLDAYLRHESLWRYEFGEISWKGRNVCMPIMRVIPRFPKI